MTVVYQIVKIAVLCAQGDGSFTCQKMKIVFLLVVVVTCLIVRTVYFMVKMTDCC